MTLRRLLARNVGQTSQPRAAALERPRPQGWWERGRRLVAVTRRPPRLLCRVGARRHQHNPAARLASELEVSGSAVGCGLRGSAPAAEPALGVGTMPGRPRVAVRALRRRLVEPLRDAVRVGDGDQVAGTHAPTIVERAFEQKRLLPGQVRGERTPALHSRETCQMREIRHEKR
jgi:hypothetical protein